MGNPCNLKREGVRIISLLAINPQICYCENDGGIRRGLQISLLTVCQQDQILQVVDLGREEVVPMCHLFYRAL